jgi:tRNA-specific 2-thiouridylase
LAVAERLGIKLHILDVVEDYKLVVLNPRYGYGANLNPCLDCKIFMLRKASEWIDAKGFDFVITGEVIGQRPKSQRKDTMPVVQRDSGLEDRLLRPLSARRLPPTLPEREGWVDRERLYGFTGRSRKPLIALAAQFGFEDYAQPAGGCCFLTDPNCTIKLRDLWPCRDRRLYELDDIMLLKVGRHIRPLALLDGSLTADDITLVGRYSQGRDASMVELEYRDRGSDPAAIRVEPMRPDDIPRDWLL